MTCCTRVRQILVALVLCRRSQAARTRPETACPVRHVTSRRGRLQTGVFHPRFDCLTFTARRHCRSGVKYSEFRWWCLLLSTDFTQDTRSTKQHGWRLTACKMSVSTELIFPGASVSITVRQLVRWCTRRPARQPRRKRC